MSPSKSKRTTKTARQQRVESQMQRVLAELISRNVRDPRVGNVTITAVEAAPDMSVARVFFVPFVGGHSPDEVRDGLRMLRGFCAVRWGGVCRCAMRRDWSSSTTR